MAGIIRLMEVLATMGVEDSTRRGQAMNYFYKQLRRWPREELVAWSIRFGEARARWTKQTQSSRRTRLNCG